MKVSIRLTLFNFRSVQSIAETSAIGKAEDIIFALENLHLPIETDQNNAYMLTVM